ncbi:hypothetical protein PROFUN_13343 [Planoprotostelium fungivorum]|uniref:Magnesium-dependent phosphatase 1-like n=1 Tax=Planoprotostelium fungivorum TaxID=1890364 RepID=A0A2P6N4N3_9EUKA|nr:hypothetical protein PROFUN_13343 [Planoprotostelium fungivorum]
MQRRRYKAFVFDYDNTLTISNSPAQRTAYLETIQQMMQQLTSNGIYVAIASYNWDTDRLLTDMGIQSKTDMIKEIRRQYRIWMRERGRHTSLRKSEIIFFDDDLFNCQAVEAYGVRAINIAPSSGIQMQVFESLLSESTQ